MERRKALVLTGDYWHPASSIEPLIPLLMPEEEWEVFFTEDPSELVKAESVPDLFVSFKDPIENDQVPTPIWCGDKWSSVLSEDIREKGMGFLAVHCGLTDLPREHTVSRDILKCFFVGHPPRCPVKFIPVQKHPITEDAEEFTFPLADEHYIVEIPENAGTQILAFTESEHGRQPALWAHSLGKGRVCCITPGHDTPNLICTEYLRLLKNAVNWAAREK